MLFTAFTDDDQAYSGSQYLQNLCLSNVYECLRTRESNCEYFRTSKISRNFEFFLDAVGS